MSFSISADLTVSRVIAHFFLFYRASVYLPVFLSPNVTKILVETFGLTVKGEIQPDLERMLG